MIEQWKRWGAEKPLLALTIIAFIPRLLAAIFSQGYFALDDHFLIIEAAGSWVQAPEYSSWLPWNQVGVPHPSGHSMVYVGLHYLLFSGLKALGMSDPKSLMVVVRLLHALWSLVVVRTGYRIALKLGDARIAWNTGLFLALFYFMPFLAVRNLVEVACIPFLMLGAWRLIRSSEAPSMRDLFVAGIWIGLATNIRFQTLFFAVGPGLALLLQQRFRSAFVYGFGALLPLFILQGGIDMLLWGRPFAEITEYVVYNLANTTSYFDQPWYNYILLLLGVFIPFFSVAVFFGFVRRTQPLLIWLPVLLFLAVHSYFPNKQERFILPVVPLFFVLGYVSWEQWRVASRWWQGRTGLWRGVMTFTWVLNIVLLSVLSVSYSKRSRIEAVYALRSENGVKGLVIEDTIEGEAPMPPLFYWGQWDATVVRWNDPEADLGAELQLFAEDVRPDVVLFIGLEDLPTRMAKAEAAMGPLRAVYRAEPGIVDRVMHWLNPVNRNETIVVMRADS